MRRRDLFYRIKAFRTGGDTFSAFDAKALIYALLTIPGGKDRIDRAGSHAGVTAPGAFFQINIIGRQLPTHPCGAAFFSDMGLILLPEILEGRLHRVGG